MIAQLRGRLVDRHPDHLVLDVNGVGYRVFVSLNTFYNLPDPGGELTLLIQTVVREDAFHLYGFLEQGEKETFNLVTGISGVGPKLGLAILSGIEPQQLWQAVRGGDAARLTKIPGIGKKTANRLLLELDGKLPQNLGGEEDAAPVQNDPIAEDALSALMNLGYPEAKASKAVAQAMKKSGGALVIEDVIKQALRTITGK